MVTTHKNVHAMKHKHQIIHSMQLFIIYMLQAKCVIRHFTECLRVSLIPWNDSFKQAFHETEGLFLSKLPYADFKNVIL